MVVEEGMEEREQGAAAVKIVKSRKKERVNRKLDSSHPRDPGGSASRNSQERRGMRGPARAARVPTYRCSYRHSH